MVRGTRQVIGDNTHDYEFTDGSTEGIEFIQSGFGNFPWEVGEPDHQVGSNENCVEYYLLFTECCITLLLADGDMLVTAW